MKGTETAFPHTYPLNDAGMTYRRYLAAHIAGDVIIDFALNKNQSPPRTIAAAIWLMTDAILEAE